MNGVGDGRRVMMRGHRKFGTICNVFVFKCRVEGRWGGQEGKLFREGEQGQRLSWAGS